MWASPYALSVPLEQVLLRRTVGRDLLMFLLTAGSVQLDRHFAGLKHVLTPSQMDVLEECADVLERIAEANPLDEPSLCLLFLDYLAQRDKHGYTRAEAFRRKTGGAAVHVGERDQLLRLLLTVGIDAYPLLIGNESGLGPRGLHDNPVGRPFIRSIRNHPLYAQLIDACRSDRVLGPASGSARFVWRHQPIEVVADPFLVDPPALPLEILNGAVGYLAIQPGAPSLRAFMEAIRRALVSARRVVRGERIDLHYCLAFSGVSLPEPVVVRTPWGILFPAGVVARGFRPFGSVADLLFVGTVSATASTANPLPLQTQPSDTRDRPGELIPLAAMLASSDDQLAAPVIEWGAAIPPLGGLQSWWCPLRVLSEWRRASPPVCSSALAQWSRTLRDRFDPSLETARSRTLRAVAERIHHEDSLVDAVTAWENVLGGGGETTFRVTGAAACMLEPRPEERAKRRDALSQIYDLRSQIVHGSPREKRPKLWAKLTELSDSAVVTAVQLLRALFRDFDDLIQQESAKRAEALLLGTAGLGEGPPTA